MVRAGGLEEGAVEGLVRYERNGAAAEAAHHRRRQVRRPRPQRDAQRHRENPILTMIRPIKLIMCGLAISPVPTECAQAERPPLSSFHFAAVLLLALAAHAIYWSTRPPDMSIFLEPWLAHIVQY